MKVENSRLYLIDISNTSSNDDNDIKYAEYMNEARENLIFSSEELDEEAYKNFIYKENPGWRDKLTDYISIDDRLNYLYLAIGIDRLSRAAISRGLSLSEAERIKRESLIRLASANTPDEHGQIALETALAYNRLYRNTLGRRYSYLVERAIEYIYQCVFVDISLRDIAGFLEVNASYLSKAFKTETKSTVTDYIRRVKMERAADMISKRTFSMQEISNSLGYTDYKKFCTSFKKHFGVPPTEYMKNR